MKTRIISGVVGIIIFICILVLSFKFDYVLSLALAALNALAIYEMLNHTGLVRPKAITIVACVFGALFVATPAIVELVGFGSVLILPVLLSFVYFFTAAVLALVFYKKMNSSGLFSSLLAPIMLSVAFFSVYLLFSFKTTKLLDFFLIFIFAWGADTGAYFTGTFIGKHKLAPEISPKKTIEGSIGGMVTAVLLSALLGYVYSASFNIDVSFLRICICAAIFSVVGMIGDLFTSFIKRDCGIKDFGKIMPGHGGVLDRFDSVLFIAPFYLITSLVF